MTTLAKQPKPHDKQAIHEAWSAEHAAARAARRVGDATAEWAHLERAHILSQPLTITHLRTHLAMLGYACCHRDGHEITGQLIRLLVAGPGSVLRRYPRGNTGGANVSAVLPMPIPDDLSTVLG